MNNIKLIIEYEGTNYFGWQKQNKQGLRTIQAEIEEAIKSTTKENIELIGCSRTDAGVHAKGFIANFKTESKVPPNKFREALNAKLPDDIVIISSELADIDFHARYKAKGKTYQYTILNRDYPSAIKRNLSYHVKKELNIAAMREAAKYFKGTHDFIAFRTQGSSVKGTVRTIFDLEIVEEEKFLKILVTGDGFLYNMVRIIVGTLINVGLGKNNAIDIIEIIENKDRTLAGPCVPAKGLLLKEVYY